MDYVLTTDAIAYTGDGHTGRIETVPVPDGGRQFVWLCSCGYEYSVPAVLQPNNQWMPEIMPDLDETHNAIAQGAALEMEHKAMEAIMNALLNADDDLTGMDSHLDPLEQPKPKGIMIRKDKCKTCPSLPLCEAIGFVD